ncbi:stage 0 sporulation protein [bacterium]|nr:stage 0 sporulation protein [bacterium]
MNVVKVKFAGSNRPVAFDSGGLAVAKNDTLVVPDDHGPRLATVFEIQEDNESAELPRVVRAATRDDIDRGTRMREREAESLLACREAVRRRELPMKVIHAEYIFDGTKIIYHFTAEGRVDFRDLVRELAQRYRTRIEMVQIGVRDAAKLLTGVGVCGRTLCCSTFLQCFAPVSVKMAKDQNLALNDSKISGVCGRLKCCLRYEHEVYTDFKRELPKVGKRAKCPEGIGRVVRHDPIARKVFIYLEEGGGEVACDPDVVERVAPPPPTPKKPRNETPDTTPAGADARDAEPANGEAADSSKGAAAVPTAESGADADATGDGESNGGASNGDAGDTGSNAPAG